MFLLRDCQRWTLCHRSRSCLICVGLPEVCLAPGGNGVRFLSRICLSTSIGSTIDRNVVLGSFGSAVGSVGTLIMVIPCDVFFLDEGTRLNISLDAKVLR